MNKIEVFPIDENGFVLWTSERYRMEPSGYRPLEYEVIVPIPKDIVWTQPRWNGYEWVEGKDHPGLPEPPIITGIPEPDPITREISILNAQIAQGRDAVISHLYDIVTAQVQCMDAQTKEWFSEVLPQIMPGMTLDEFELVQVHGEPNSTGKSQWRRWVEERDRLVGELKGDAGYGINN